MSLSRGNGTESNEHLSVVTFGDLEPGWECSKTWEVEGRSGATKSSSEFAWTSPAAGKCLYSIIEDDYLCNEEGSIGEQPSPGKEPNPLCAHHKHEGLTRDRDLLRRTPVSEHDDEAKFLIGLEQF